MPKKKKLPPQIWQMWHKLRDQYNEVATSFQKHRDKMSWSQKACVYLARTVIEYSHAILFLIEGGWLLPADSLLRTCIESQARATYIMNLKPSKREKEAEEFLSLIDLVRAAECEKVIAAKSTPTEDVVSTLLAALDDPKFQASCKEAHAKGFAMLAQGETFKKRIHRVQTHWGYTSVNKLTKAIPPAERQMPMLEHTHYNWMMGSWTVHGSPAALLPNVSPDTLYPVVLSATFAAVYALLKANGEDGDVKLAAFTKLFDDYFND